MIASILGCFWYLCTALRTAHLDWWQKCREKSIAEVLQSKDIVLINDLDDEIADDEQDVRKTTASETLDSLYAVKWFAKIHGDKQMNVMLNELMEKMKNGNTQVAKD